MDAVYLRIDRIRDLDDERKLHFCRDKQREDLQ
jgi:hypothetical protein